MRNLLDIIDTISESRGLSAREPGAQYSRGADDDDQIVFKSLT